MPSIKSSVINRVFKAGIGVDSPAHRLDRPGHLAWAAGGGTLKNQMFDKVGNPGLVGLFANTARLDPDLDGGHSRPRGFPGQNGQTVFKHILIKVWSQLRGMNGGGHKLVPKYPVEGKE